MRWGRAKTPHEPRTAAVRDKRQPPVSLQRRLLLYLLISAPLVWGAAVVVSYNRAGHEVNELFDSEMIRLARQVQATLSPSTGDGAASAPLSATGSTGEADVRDLAIAVWGGDGRLLLADREGVSLPRLPQAAGFVDLTIGGNAWRAYYLQSFDGRWLVAAGQNAYEREELVYNLTASQLTPWLLVLPLLMVAMAWAVRQALAPVRQLTVELAERGPDDLKPVPTDHAPAELAPLVGAMNALFGRIELGLERERRFTADAAHELRTPLAVLRAQWDVVRRAAGDAEQRALAETKLSAGLDRMDRLVTQLLALSRLDDTSGGRFELPLRWPEVVEAAMSDCLALAERRHIELACDWPESHGRPDPAAALPLRGDTHLMTLLLRNLLDNAVRYAPPQTQVLLRFGADRLEVHNAGPALDTTTLQRLGERFYRPDGQEERGSGLGVSIAQRIAELHGLKLAYGAGPDGLGVVATVRRAQAA